MAPPDLVRPARLPPPRVLLVEPHADTRELYHLWLTQLAFSVSVATSGDAALETARRWAPDVVLIEPMVERGGLHLLRAARSEAFCRDAIVAVVTTRAEDSIRRCALEAGADVYLVKPCEVRELGAEIARASRDRLLLVPPDTAGDDSWCSRRKDAAQRSRAICERFARLVMTSHA